MANSLLPIPFWAEAVNTACYVQNRVLVTKPHTKTPYELLHAKTPSIDFMRSFGCHVTILNTLDSLEKAREESDQHYVLFLVWSSGSTNPQNINGDATFDEKEPKFEGRKPESEKNISLSNSAQKQDDKTKREAKGKSPVESLTGYRNLSAEFEDFSDNSINVVNAVGTLVSAVGQISLNNTNTFSAAGPLNVVASPTHGKSLKEPKRVHQALKDLSWIEAIQEELLQFKMQKVWVLVDLSYGKRAIGTKWVFKNKKDERGIMFWTTVAVKKVNDVTRLQALVDKKKVVITEASIRDILHLDDAEGVDCLPNEEIFSELARMGYEKPSTKLTFYKAFFSSQWKFLIHIILQWLYKYLIVLGEDS
nr:retrovirus-related Pol polyprotein from transposon TNT 1-94 [Tanacetum cinerariifolium]